MEIFCIVPCGKRKIWDKSKKAGPTSAREVYIGPFAKKCREYAEKFFPNSYCILSAKYGFLFPQEIILGPYNVSFKDKTTNPISINLLEKQVHQKNLNQYSEIIVLGGKAYTEMVKKAFPEKEVINLLEGCTGNGYMMQKLDQFIKSGTTGLPK